MKYKLKVLYLDKSTNLNFHLFLDLDGFTFNREITSNLLLKKNHGKVRFMIYNNVFWEYYTGFPKYLAIFFALFITATILIGVQGFILFVIIHEIMHHDI